MIENWNLVKTNLDRLSKNKPEAAIIPVAAIEPHNRHLPEGQDFFHTSYVAEQSCKTAWDKCKSVICLPTIPYGVDCNLMDFPLAIHVSQATLDAMIKDIIISLLHHGIKKIVIINGHGGNDFSPLIRQIQCDLDVHVFLCNWWTVAMDKYEKIFEKPDDHAGEFETSIALELFPELVEYKKAGDGIAKPFRFEALQKGWIKTSRRFAKLNDHCATGEPSDATAEKGRKYLDVVLERISNFLVELAETPIDDSFPHLPGKTKS
ncbi:creatininase family protein [candidate division KSB1 bacterium]|nr:creatininase family protein [candidate division KSB1 bacterium]